MSLKKITTAGATTAAVTKKVWGRVRLSGLLNFKLSIAKLERNMG